MIKYSITYIIKDYAKTPPDMLKYINGMNGSYIPERTNKFKLKKLISGLPVKALNR